MTNYWNIPGVPHKGWTCFDVIDLQDQSEDFENCMMCGKEEIRFVHILFHPKVATQFRVGCKCAEKMTEDLVNPENRQRELQNRAQRKKNWMIKKWSTSAKGNDYLRLDKHRIVILKDSKTQKYKFSVDGKFDFLAFKHLHEVKGRIFLVIEKLRNDGKW